VKADADMITMRMTAVDNLNGNAPSANQVNNGVVGAGVDGTVLMDDTHFGYF
jgi:hypothetical protein